MSLESDHAAMLAVALAEARKGLAEGGLPIGAAMHAETDAFRRAGRQRSYRKLVMVTTLAPCWYCSGLVRQFGFGKLIVGESRNFRGGIDWLRSNGIAVIDLDSAECASLLADYIRENRAVWNEDIGQE
jgi:cytosine deaminase